MFRLPIFFIYIYREAGMKTNLYSARRNVQSIVLLSVFVCITAVIAISSSGALSLTFCILVDLYLTTLLWATTSSAIAEKLIVLIDFSAWQSVITSLSTTPSLVISLSFALSFLLAFLLFLLNQILSFALKTSVLHHFCLSMDFSLVLLVVGWTMTAISDLSAKNV